MSWLQILSKSFKKRTLLTVLLWAISFYGVRSQYLGNPWDDENTDNDDPEVETIPQIAIIIPQPFPTEEPMFPTVRSRSRSSSGRSIFGERCDETTRCAGNSQLSCIDQTCQCVKPEEMIYDEVSSRCVIRSGEKCKYEIVTERLLAKGRSRTQSAKLFGGLFSSNDYSEGSSSDEFVDTNDDYGIPESTRRETRYLVFPCVSNSRCLNEVCKCNPTFYENIQGMCEKKREFGSNCTADIECKEQPGVSCSGGYCRCNPLVSKESKIKNRCGGLPGKPCIQRQCANNTVCNRNICSCSPGFTFDSTEQTCKVNFGGSCKYSEDCHGSLGCLNGFCSCPWQNHQLFDNSKNKCVSIVAAPCVTDQDCVPNSKCKNATRNGIQEQTCQCSENFLESGPGFCRSSHGASCSTTDWSTEPTYRVKTGSLLAEIVAQENGRANDDAGYTIIKLGTGCAGNLNCINSTCSCESGMERFCEKLGMCVGLTGSLCRLESVNYCGEDRNTCMPINGGGKQDTKFGKCTFIDAAASEENEV